MFHSYKCSNNNQISGSYLTLQNIITGRTQTSPIINYVILGEWRGLVVSAEDCHSKG